jgi:hypothetical protein
LLCNPKYFTLSSMPDSPADTPSLTRNVIVTLGLSAAGVLVGGAAGALALLVAMVVSGWIVHIADLWVLAIPAIIGALLGLVLAPAAGWMLLRRVPLGRAYLGLATGTVVGGVLGCVLVRGWMGAESAIGGAVVGFCLAAVMLRRLAGSREAFPTGSG